MLCIECYLNIFQFCYDTVSFLQILGVFDWAGVNPLLPELWILPSFLPIHPGLCSSSDQFKCLKLPCTFHFCVHPMILHKNKSWKMVRSIFELVFVK